VKRPDPKEIAASLSVGGDDKPDDYGDEDQGPESDLEAAMADFCDAEKSEDYKGMAEAFRHAFTLLESEPHEEAGEPEEESEEPAEK